MFFFFFWGHLHHTLYKQQVIVDFVDTKRGHKVQPLTLNDIIGTSKGQCVENRLLMAVRTDWGTLFRVS